MGERNYSFSGPIGLQVEELTNDSIKFSYNLDWAENYESFQAFTDNDKHGNCSISDMNVTCEIKELSPGTEYTVFLYGCIDMTTTTADEVTDTSQSTDGTTASDQYDSTTLSDGSCQKLGEITTRTALNGEPKQFYRPSKLKFLNICQYLFYI